MQEPVARFAPFSLDLETLELRRDGAPVPLEPQPARLLALLVERQGALVTRSQAAACLWGDHTNVAQGDGLHYAVRRIRLALGDTASSPAYVETLPRRGYRFVAPVVLEPRAAAPRRRRAALAATAAGFAALIVILESLPNDHHETTMWLLETVHAAVF